MRAGTHADRILALLAKSPDLDDDEIAQALEIEPRQTANQICRLLAGRGFLVRERGPRGKIVNRLAADRPLVNSTFEAVPRRPTSRGSVQAYDGETLVPEDFARTLIVLPCSGAKRDDPVVTRGKWIGEYLPASLAAELREAQAAIKARLAFHEEALVPAWQRYDGTLYRTGREAIAGLMEAGAHVVILSGGYGLVSATEPIGNYNTILKRAWWPRRVLERALVAYAGQAGLVSVRSFASATTAYRQVLQRVSWQAEGVEDALLVMPERRPGGLLKSPATLGEALVALHAGKLTTGWRSSYGLGLTVLHS
jgi:hypothetical protein